MNLKEFYDYKSLLMKDLCSNERIVSLITDKSKPSVPDKSLPYNFVYPFEFIPETVNEGHTFICFDVDIQSVVNKTLYIPVIYIWVFTHKSKMRVSDGGIRVDEITIAIDEMLNGNRTYGLGTLSLSSVERFSPILDYQGRVMVYYAKDFNRSNNIRHTLPSNRKQNNI